MCQLLTKEHIQSPLDYTYNTLTLYVSIVRLGSGEFGRLEDLVYLIVGSNIC